MTNAGHQLLAVSDFGSWEARVENGREHLVLRSSGPPWRRVFAALDAASARFSDRPVDPLDEADVVVACCWRYGSYAHVLSEGRRHPELGSHPGIRDAEMRRINIEFSAATADWLALREADPDRIRRRVRAALATFELPWRTARVGPAILTANEMQGVIERMSTSLRETPGLSDLLLELQGRAAANALVRVIYRDGHIEDCHAGWGKEDTQASLAKDAYQRLLAEASFPRYRRLTQADVRKIGDEASTRLARHLLLMSLGERGRQTAQLILHAFPTPDWTISDDTADISFKHPDGAGALWPLAEQAWRSLREVRGALGTMR